MNELTYMHVCVDILGFNSDDLDIVLQCLEDFCFIVYNSMMNEEIILV